MKKHEKKMSDSGKKPKSRKRLVITLVVIAVVVICGITVLAVRHHRQAELDQEMGDVSSDSSDDVDSTSYFNGIIEPQQTWEIQKDADRTISQVYVSEGDSVTVGQQLFSYDTSDISLQLQQAQIEAEGIQDDINGYAAQVKELQSQRAAAPADQQLDYTSQIQDAQNSQKQSQLSLKQKQAEVANLQKSVNNSVVTSTINGVVRKINSNPDDTSSAYMTILSTGAYQVKCTVDETNISSLSEGMHVTVHSRIDKKTWSGSISKIDTENVDATSSDSPGYSSDSSNDMQATKYTFYVSLDTADDLLLGQHVYVEPDFDDADASSDSSAADSASTSQTEDKNSTSSNQAEDGADAPTAQ